MSVTVSGPSIAVGIVIPAANSSLRSFKEIMMN